MKTDGSENSQKFQQLFFRNTSSISLTREGGEVVSDEINLKCCTEKSKHLSKNRKTAGKKV